MTSKNWIWVVIGVLVGMFVMPMIMAKLNSRKTQG